MHSISVIRLSTTKKWEQTSESPEFVIQIPYFSINETISLNENENGQVYDCAVQSVHSLCQCPLDTVQLRTHRFWTDRLVSDVYYTV